MKKTGCVLIVFFLALTSARLSSAQYSEESLFQDRAIKAGLGFEYFSRTIGWDEIYKSSLKSLLYTLNLEFESQEGLFFNIVLGYSPSNFYDLVFRELPFSLKISEETKIVKGIVFGGDIQKSLISNPNLEIAGLGQFLYYLGKTQSWEIPDLAVPGTAKGRPIWVRASVGPAFIYRGFDSFSPYLYLSFNKLWGTFKVKETVEDLEATEKQRFSAKSSFCASLGFNYVWTSTLSLKGEASFMPYKKGADTGFMIKLFYSF